MLRILSIIWLVLGILAIVLMKRKEKDSRYSECSCGDHKKLKKVVKLGSMKDCPNCRIGLKSWKFWSMWLMIFCSACFGIFMVNTYKPLGSLYYDDLYLTFVGGMGSVANGFSRFFWATMMDYQGFKKAYGALLILHVIVACSFYYVIKVKALYIIWVCLAYFCYGGHFSMFAT
jgi:hypothetical protein